MNYKSKYQKPKNIEVQQQPKFNFVTGGTLDSYTDFKVDNFYCNRKDNFTFFLSHMHSGRPRTNLLLLRISWYLKYYRPLERAD